MTRTIGAVAVLFSTLTCAAPSEYAPPAPKVPLAEWQPEEAKLLGIQTVTRADLPEEWQELNDGELTNLFGELLQEGSDLSFGDAEVGIPRNFSAAVRPYSQARYIALALGDEVRAGVFLWLVTNALEKTWRLEQAISYAEALLGEYEELSTGTAEKFSGALNLKGRCHLGLGEYEKAQQAFERAMEYAVSGKLLHVEGECFDLTGDVYRSVGSYAAAIESYENALTVFRALPGQPHPSGGEPYGPPDDPNILHLGAYTLNDLGSLYVDLGRYEEARGCFEEYYAVEMQRDDPVSQAMACNSMGVVCLELGRYEEALQYLQQSLDIGITVKDPGLEAGALLNEGRTLILQGEQEAGLSCVREALDIYRRIECLPGEVGALTFLGGYFSRRDRMHDALSMYSEAFDLHRELARQFTWESGLKGGLVADLYDTGTELAQVQIGLGMPERAFATVQSAKSVPLLQLLAQAQRQVDDPEAQQALSSYRSAQALLQDYRESLTKMPSTGTTEQRERLERTVEKYETKARKAWALVSELDPRLSEAIEVKGLTVEEVQSEWLATGQAVLEYLLTEEEVIIFALPKQGNLFVARSRFPDLGEYDSIDEWIDHQVALLLDPRAIAYGKAGRKLYELLLAPVANVLDEADHLIVCPDGSLYSVPFDALVDPDGVPVLDRRALTYSTSASMLRYTTSSRVADGMLVAGVSFSGEMPADLDGNEHAADEPSASGRSLSAVMHPRDTLRALPGVFEETARVAEILGTAPQLDEIVSESWLQENLAGRRVVHLSTHGRLSPTSLLTGFYVYKPAETGAGQQPEEDRSSTDGFVSMAEVMGIPMDGCELVVLSCCHGFKGEISDGQGLMGISQGFLYAGVDAVIASQARVDDAATRVLMTEFYRNWWQQGMSKREALRAAKQTLVADPEFAAPRYWAPFVLYGTE